jgi:hypothetical protein
MPTEHWIDGIPVRCLDAASGKYFPREELQQVYLRRERQAQFTAERKLHALAHRFYGGIGAGWVPKAGDFYTLTRATLELFQVARVEDGQVWIVNCLGAPETVQESPFPLEGFSTEGFGINRVHVGDWIFNLTSHVQGQPLPSE